MPDAVQRLFASLLALGAVFGAPAAAALEVAGVAFEEHITLANAPLLLNGAGVRYQAFFRVMAAGLYLGQKTGTPEAVLAAPGPKRLKMTLLMDVQAKKFSKEFIRGFGHSAHKSQMSRLIPGLARMGTLIDGHGKFVRGDTIAVDWIPGSGAVISINGVAQGEPFKEQEFFDTLLSTWIGATPADWRLKDALLGL